MQLSGKSSLLSPKQLSDGVYLLPSAVNKPSQKSTPKRKFKRATEKLKQLLLSRSRILKFFLCVEREFYDRKKNQARRVKTYWRYCLVVAVWKFQTIQFVKIMI